MEKILNSFEFVELFWQDKKGYVFLPKLTVDGGWIEGDAIFYSKSTREKVKEYVEKSAKEDLNIYFAPMTFAGPKRTNVNATITDWLWADTDDGIVNLPAIPSLVVKSSEKSYQSYWKLDTTLDRKKHNALNRIVNWSQKADRNGWGSTKVLRLVDSSNLKKDRDNFTVIVDSYNENLIYKPKEILENALNHFELEWVKNYGKGKFINDIKMFGIEWEEYENKHTVQDAK